MTAVWRGQSPYDYQLSFLSVATVGDALKKQGSTETCLDEGIRGLGHTVPGHYSVLFDKWLLRGSKRSVSKASDTLN